MEERRCETVLFYNTAHVFTLGRVCVYVCVYACVHVDVKDDGKESGSRSLQAMVARALSFPMPCLALLASQGWGLGGDQVSLGVCVYPGGAPVLVGICTSS